MAGLPPGGHGIRLRVLPDCPRGGSSPPSLHRDARDRSYSHLTRKPLSQLFDLTTRLQYLGIVLVLPPQTMAKLGGVLV